MAVPLGFAQQSRLPSLDDMLQRLQSNLLRYRADVPSFFCEEHMVSILHQYPNQASRITEAKSVFRLKREENEDGVSNLTESREVKTIDGRPTTGSDIGGQSMLTGAFSGGLSVVSLSQQACMHYTLRPIKPGTTRGYYVIDFSAVPANERPADCILQEDGSGRVFIDPESMQVTRLEIKVPHHRIFPTTASGLPMPPLLGSWEISVVYAPVMLDGRQFWMPSDISSRTMTNSVDWSFKASYRNYHKLEVSSRILPVGPPPEP